MSTYPLGLTYEPLSRAAERTGLTVQDLRRRIVAGQLHAYRCGARIIRVDAREIDSLGEAELRERGPATLPTSI